MRTFNISTALRGARQGADPQFMDEKLRNESILTIVALITFYLLRFGVGWI